MRRLVLLLALSGCASTAAGPYQPSDEGESGHGPCPRALAEGGGPDLHRPRGGRAASARLTADVFFGPAHNNLGVLYLSQDKLYEAANEFEWARKVMPGHPDPRMNMAITLERAGRWDEAIQTYRTALEVFPGHLPTEQALARLLSEADPKDPELAPLLDRIQLQGESAGWREWARGLGSPEFPIGEPPSRVSPSA